jgi:hypothetical protein
VKTTDVFGKAVERVIREVEDLQGVKEIKNLARELG